MTQYNDDLPAIVGIAIKITIRISKCILRFSIFNNQGRVSLRAEHIRVVGMIFSVIWIADIANWRASIRPDALLMLGSKKPDGVTRICIHLLWILTRSRIKRPHCERKPHPKCRLHDRNDIKRLNIRLAEKATKVCRRETFTKHKTVSFSELSPFG